MIDVCQWANIGTVFGGSRFFAQGTAGLHPNRTWTGFMEFWMNCLADVFELAGEQLVERFNLQCYAGGTGNTTIQWVQALSSFDRSLGIPDVNSFVVPSNWVQSDNGQTKNSPADIRKFFSDPSIRENAAGGFLWNTSEMFASGYTSADYAKAVLNGLASNG